MKSSLVIYKTWLALMLAVVSASIQAKERCDIHSYQRCQTQLGIYVTGQVGRADSDTSQSSFNSLYQLQGVDASAFSVDDTDTGYGLGFGYQMTPMWAIETGFVDLGDRSLDFTGSSLQPNTFTQRVKAVYPETAEGFTLAVVGSYVVSDVFKVAAKLGIFDWETEFQTTVNSGNTGNVYNEGSNIWYGAELQYRYNDNTQLFLSLAQYELDRHDNQLLSAGFRYYFKPKKYAAPKSVPIKPTPVKVVSLDSDKDGVFDEVDNCANTPITHKVDVAGCSMMAEQLVDYSLVIRFQPNSDEIADEYQNDLNEMVAFINKYNVKSLTVYGHTSAVGRASYNQTLSQKRADSLRSRLINDYLVDTEITAIGRGETELLEQGNTTAAHALNRRVTLAIEEKLVVPVLK